MFRGQKDKNTNQRVHRSKYRQRRGSQRDRDREKRQCENQQ